MVTDATGQAVTFFVSGRLLILLMTVGHDRDAAFSSAANERCDGPDMLTLMTPAR